MNGEQSNIDDTSPSKRTFKLNPNKHSEMEHVFHKSCQLSLAEKNNLYEKAQLLEQNKPTQNYFQQLQTLDFKLCCN